MELELIRQGGVWGPEDDSFLEKWMLDDIEGINLNLLWRSSLLYRNQSIDFQGWFLCNRLEKEDLWNDFHNLNTRVYNLISVPQTTRLLLEDVISSSKTEPHNGSKKENQSYGGEVRNNKAVLKILSLIWILYLNKATFAIFSQF